jgi:phosphocarrier protein
MLKSKVVIADEYGIHARPAGLLVKKAQELPGEVTLAKGAKTADAKKLFAVMKLGAKQGEELVISCEGGDELAALEAILAVLKETALI